MLHEIKVRKKREIFSRETNYKKKKKNTWKLQQSTTSEIKKKKNHYMGNRKRGDRKESKKIYIINKCPISMMTLKS